MCGVVLCVCVCVYVCVCALAAQTYIHILHACACMHTHIHIQHTRPGQAQHLHSGHTDVGHHRAPPAGHAPARPLPHAVRVSLPLGGGHVCVHGARGDGYQRCGRRGRGGRGGRGGDMCGWGGGEGSVAAESGLPVCLFMRLVSYVCPCVHLWCTLASSIASASTNTVPCLSRSNK